MERKKPNKKLLALFGLVHLFVTALTWHDISGRPAGSIRGDRRMWYVLSALNSGNSVVYWLFGRRRPVGSPSGSAG